MIKNLNQKEKNVVFGGIASIEISKKNFKFVATGNQVTDLGKTSVNGMKFNMIIHSTYVTNLKGKIIFSGNQGSFCHGKKLFTVTPYKNGGISKHFRSWNPDTDGITVQYSGSC